MLFRRLLALGLIVGLGGCSSAQKKPEFKLGALSGKKVALVGIEAEPTARTMIEVALVNQLIERGSFILIPRQDVEAAKKAPEQDPTDWKGIAKAAGADVALRAVVHQFDSTLKEGYSTEWVYDSQIAAEQGTDGKVEQTFPVKSLTTTVEVELLWTDLKQTPNATLSTTAEASETVVENARKSAIHLPPKLRMLETITARAFKRLFDRSS
jgi:hypothetical protein